MRTSTLMLLAAATLAALLAGAATQAFAYNQTGYLVPNSDGYGDCGFCHYPATMGTGSGPHGGFTKNTHACDTCHTTHDAPGSYRLLVGNTLKQACDMCHDGSGGRGVYGTIAKRGLTVGGQHRIETASVVPGGSAADGGSATMTLSGPGGTLTCSDCHSAHGNACVTPFLGERQREPALGSLLVPTSNHLLKQRPGNVATAVADYGSDWCLACHKGRVSGGAIHNHPVETTATGTYNYRLLGIVGPAPYPTSVTVTGPAGINTQFTGYNRAYLMPYPRTGAQAGHLPICQQCHEDRRYVGTLTADGTQAIPSTATVTSYPAGINPADNPRFQNFPHETEGYRMLVEAGTTSAGDDLCLNCHPPAALP